MQQRCLPCSVFCACFSVDRIMIISLQVIAMPKGLYFTLVVFSQRLISEVTERILTKLGHIFTYDCFLVRTSAGMYPHGLGDINALGDRLWTLTEHVSATEYDINNWKETYQSTGTTLHAPNLVNFSPKMDENDWRVFAHPLNFRIERHCQHYRMDVI